MTFTSIASDGDSSVVNVAPQLSQVWRRHVYGISLRGRELVVRVFKLSQNRHIISIYCHTPGKKSSGKL